MKSFFIVALAMVLAACGGPTTRDYAARTPTLDLREYLNGELVAKGILFDYRGRVDTTFRVDMTGTWKGNKGTLAEHFRYSDGREEDRTWHITFTDDHRFTATAADVIGKADGTQHGNSVNMQYTLNAKRPDGDTITLSMDDWMYLLDDRTLINRTSMHKYGLKVGELVIAFERKDRHEK